MQEQRGLVEQALGRFDPLDDDAARHRVQPRVLLRRQLPAGEHHDRQIGERRVVADTLQQVEAGHIRQPQVEHDAVDGCSRSTSSASPPVPTVDDLDVVVAEQLAMLELLGGVVLDDQQALAARLGVGLDPCRAPLRGRPSWTA